MANQGNLYLFKVGNSGSEVAVDGQLDGTMTQAGVHVDTSNKSSGGYVTVMEGFLAGKGVTFAGSFNRENATQQNALIDASETGDFVTGIIEAGDGESWQGTFSVSGRSDTATKDGIVTTALTIASSGAYVYTAPTT